MAKDDMFRIIYCILKELYECKKQGVRFCKEDISHERFGLVQKQGRDFSFKTTGANIFGVELSSDETKMIQQYAKSEGVIDIHSHLTNILPTGNDFVAAGARKYKFGIIATHDERVFLYKVGEKPFRSEYFGQTVDKYVSTPYNYDIEKAQIWALKKFEKEFGVEWKELK